jgi:hypothetical protein
VFYASFNLVVTPSVRRSPPGHRLDHGDAGFRAGGVQFSVSFATPTGATIVCTFGGVLIRVFLVHVLFFHGHKVHPLEAAAALEIPREQVLEGAASGRVTVPFW